MKANTSCFPDFHEQQLRDNPDYPYSRSYPETAEQHERVKIDLAVEIDGQKGVFLEIPTRQALLMKEAKERVNIEVGLYMMKNGLDKNSPLVHKKIMEWEFAVFRPIKELTMCKQSLKPKPQEIVYDDTLPNCIIFDVDGTLAHMGDRSPYDESKVINDRPNYPVTWLYSTLQDGCVERESDIKFFIFSGRSEDCRKDTDLWITNQGLLFHTLFMRPSGDKRKDSIVKQELYEKHIKGKYNVLFVVDDRQQVVDMWRSLGLTCLQVAEGDF